MTDFPWIHHQWEKDGNDIPYIESSEELYMHAQSISETNGSEPGEWCSLSPSSDEAERQILISCFAV